MIDELAELKIYHGTNRREFLENDKISERYLVEFEDITPEERDALRLNIIRENLTDTVYYSNEL